MSGMMGAGGAALAAGGDGGDDSGGAGNSPQETVLVTVTQLADGSYKVYDGDEDDSSEGAGGSDSDDMSDEDVAALPNGNNPASAGAAGGAADEGKPASTEGQALKLVNDILQSHKMGGNAEDQFASGFSGPQAPQMAARQPMKQKYGA